MATKTKKVTMDDNLLQRQQQQQHHHNHARRPKKSYVARREAVFACRLVVGPNHNSNNKQPLPCFLRRTHAHWRRRQQQQLLRDDDDAVVHVHALKPKHQTSEVYSYEMRIRQDGLPCPFCRVKTVRHQLDEGRCCSSSSGQESYLIQQSFVPWFTFDVFLSLFIGSLPNKACGYI